MLTGHGNDRYAFGGKIRYDFSSNIPWINHSGEIISYLKEHPEVVQNYPDPLASELTEKIASRLGLPGSRVLVTSGSAEAFYLLAHCFERRRSAVAVPAFAEYEDAARAYRHRLSFTPFDLVEDAPKADLLWFAYPNNPDGRLLPLPVLKSLLARNPRRTVIIDNAYGELCPKAEDLLPLVKEVPNLVLVRSLTKTFGIPGLRLGFVLIPEKLAPELRKLRIPWSVNALALEAGSFILDHYDALLPDEVALARESKALQTDLATLPDLEVTPSPTNYFLVRMRRGTAAELKAFLIETRGILIRDASNFRSLTPGHFRLSVQSPEANQALIEGLKDYFSR